MSGEEIELVQQAFADNWVAPAGPYLALLVIGIQPGDEVMVSTLTEALGSRYRGRHSGTMGKIGTFPSLSGAETPTSCSSGAQT
jgi:dTDP-4-amino-4,6-dideoxygalactose transaminase